MNLILRLKIKFFITISKSLNYEKDFGIFFIVGDSTVYPRKKLYRNAEIKNIITVNVSQMY